MDARPARLENPGAASVASPVSVPPPAAKTRLLGIVPYLALLFLALVSGCSRPAEKASPAAATPVRIGYTPITANAMVFYARDKDWFGKRGISATFLPPFRSTNESIEAFLRGETDVAYCPSVDVALNAELRAPGSLRLIGFSTNDETHSYEAFVVPKDSPLKSAKDLEGRSIGCFRSPFAQNIGGLMVRRAIGEGKKFDIRPLDFAVQADALLGGQVDALFAYEPRISQLEATGKARVLEASPITKLLFSPFPGAAVLMRSSFLKEHPKEAAAFLRANSELLEYCEAHRDETIPSIATATSMDQQKDAAVLKSLRQSRFESVEQVDRKALQKVVDLFAAEKVLSGPFPDVARLIEETPKQ